MTRKKTKTATTHERERLFTLNCCFSFLSFLVALTIFSSVLLARDRPKPERHALIFGTVWGPDNRALAGIEVKIRRSDQKKAHWDVHSNARGEFEIAVPAGRADYVIWAVTSHYKLSGNKHLQRSPEVTVHIENDERADTGLHLK
jgi:hypothetical protein